MGGMLHTGNVRSENRNWTPDRTRSTRAMISNLVVQEGDRDLLFQVTAQQPLTMCIGSAAVSAGFAAMVVHWLAAPTLLVLIAGVTAGILALVRARRPKGAELRVTNLAYVSRGVNAGALFQAPRRPING